MYFSHLSQETQNIRNMLAHNMRRAHEVFNSLPGFSCQPLGGAFLFPRVCLPAKAIQKAKVTFILKDKVNNCYECCIRYVQVNI